ncbi:MAG: alpha/beta hydrolase family esterase [Candidatus Cryptobacteroides sp.]
MKTTNGIIRKSLALCAFILVATFASDARQFQKLSMKHGGLTREYWLYVPDSLASERPLVIMLHGYGGNAENYRPEMAEVAQKNGFVLCVPQGYKAPKGKPGWNVRYPAQEGMTTDDVDFVCALKKRIVKDWGLDSRNCFLCGMSNGGDMCYLTVLQRPEAFTAYGSVAGLTMEWCYRQYSMTKAVPFLEVHGTADRTSRWEGDPDNDGGWGEYISVPIAVDNVVTACKCTHCEDTELPLIRNRVILHRYLGGVPAWKGGPAVEVRLYEVQEGKHSWALADFDTCSALWDFFKIYLR